MEIEIKTPEQLRLMRAAGLVVAAALAATRDAVKPGVTTADLDAVAEDVIRSHGAVPSFKGYHGFPATICSSVNEQVVHTIPNARHVLAEGDLISIDCGAILNGWHGDAAITVGVGETRPELLRMAAVAEDSMWAGIAAAARGVRAGTGRLTDVSYAIESSVRNGGGPYARATGTHRKYGIVKGYGGHGIGTAMHQEPHIHNHGRPGRGPKLIPGMALAIEPMITMGSARTVELSDGWTVVTSDGSAAAHVEHSIGLFEDGVWVLTAEDGGRDRLGDLLTAQAA
ncbi:methionine aminopeptidase [Catellatospora sp. TT07R-123]|uniref:type I methionyl aminopeptidase n=1 Tax=Catellatospora sp. TT07R-123 TaxID=2733863 RepID=UPI001B007E71|nr:type I methionyl aminopeptidase [Catellatospora sp. TT07R-123]GHJ46142.1 methionine aminopeptidase [Catellatospora sp. TT07R-123]